MKTLILSNNPLTQKNTLVFEGNFHYLQNKTLLEILLQARDYVHLGHELLTHPLTGSIKPSETMYKSIILSHKAKETVDLASLEKIENCIAITKKMLSDSKIIVYPDDIKDDFQLIDFSLLKTGLESINQFC
ncbi:MAG: GrdX family protein [Fusobacteriaceae bacterium]